MFKKRDTELKVEINQISHRKDLSWRDRRSAKGLLKRRRELIKYIELCNTKLKEAEEAKVKILQKIKNNKRRILSKEDPLGDVSYVSVCALDLIGSQIRSLKYGRDTSIRILRITKLELQMKYGIEFR